MEVIEQPPNPVPADQADYGKDDSDGEILPKGDGDCVKPVDEKLREECDQVSDRSPHASLDKRLPPRLHRARPAESG